MIAGKSPSMVSNHLLMSPSRRRQELYWQAAMDILPEVHRNTLRGQPLDLDSLTTGLEQLKSRTSMEPVIDANGKTILTRGRMHMILSKVQKYTSIVGVAVQHSPEVTSLVWAGMRFLLDVSCIPRTCHVHPLSFSSFINCQC